jgi:Lrp/AsnC family transcriptional regulator for asnA, asnC and gidA
MDKIDLQIIKELSQNARKSFRKIAKKIGVSTQTLIRRYNEMREKGIIEFCSITIDLDKIGYKGTAYLLIHHSSQSTLDGTIKELKNIPNVVIASKALGDFEVYAILLFKDIEDLYEKVVQIKNLLTVSKVEVSFAIPGIRYFVAAYPFQIDKILLVNKQLQE